MYSVCPEQIIAIVASFGGGSATGLAIENEWEHISRALNDCGGNISHAAKALGLHRQSLQRKLRLRAARGSEY
jgi:transcriptional regulator of acetoin/glycerol metabolism